MAWFSSSKTNHKVPQPQLHQQPKNPFRNIQSAGGGSSDLLRFIRLAFLALVFGTVFVSLVAVLPQHNDNNRIAFSDLASSTAAPKSRGGLRVRSKQTGSAASDSKKVSTVKTAPIQDRSRNAKSKDREGRVKKRPEDDEEDEADDDDGKIQGDPEDQVVFNKRMGEAAELVKKEQHEELHDELKGHVFGKKQNETIAKVEDNKNSDSLEKRGDIASVVVRRDAKRTSNSDTLVSQEKVA